MLDEQRRGVGIEKHTAQTIALAGGRSPRRNAGLTHGVDICAAVYQELQQRVPSSIGRTEQRVLTIRGDRPGIDTQLEQKFDCLERLIFGDRAFAEAFAAWTK